MNKPSVENANQKTAPSFAQQGANVLLAATCEFLRRNNIKDEQIISFVRRRPRLKGSDTGLRKYQERVRAYEQLGLLIGTWFSNPKFLDHLGNPLPISISKGPRSLVALIRSSGVEIDPIVALDLMKQSPSIKTSSDGTLSALKKVFVIPNLDVPRAAFVVERYLSTLQKNADGRKAASTLLLERSCHVSKLDMAQITPILRDIESRGTAFMDSIDGDIEDRRLRKTKRKNVGELGVLVFAWTRAPERNRQKIKHKS